MTDPYRDNWKAGWRLAAAGGLGGLTALVQPGFAEGFDAYANAAECGFVPKPGPRRYSGLSAIAMLHGGATMRRLSSTAFSAITIDHLNRVMVGKSVSLGNLHFTSLSGADLLADDWVEVETTKEPGA